MMQVDFNESKPGPENIEPQTCIPICQNEDVLCDRCCMTMFRMRAVYWCEHCGYKTDCCGS